MSLYILRGGLGITGASPPGLPEIRTAAAQARGTAGLARASPVPASRLCWGGMRSSSPSVPRYASQGRLPVSRWLLTSWVLVSGLAVASEVLMVTPSAFSFLEPTVCVLSRRVLALHASRGGDPEMEGWGWPVNMWAPFHPHGPPPPG